NLYGYLGGMPTRFGDPAGLASVWDLNPPGLHDGFPVAIDPPPLVGPVFPGGDPLLQQPPRPEWPEAEEPYMTPRDNGLHDWRQWEDCRRKCQLDCSAKAGTDHEKVVACVR